MYEQSRVAVVVPAYNEEGLVGRVIETMPQFVDYVYVIDDCSADGTWEEIEQHSTHVLSEGTFELAPLVSVDDDQAVVESRHVDSQSQALESVDDDPVVVESRHEDDQGRALESADVDQIVVGLRHETNQGRGSCIKRGYRRALTDGADVVAVMDGDGQMDPAELDRIIDPVVKGQVDYAKGTRLQDRAHIAKMSNWRLFGNLLLSLLTNLSSGYWGLLDSQNGYTAISRSALETIPIDTLYDRYGFLNDLLTTLNVNGLRIAEVPHPAVYDQEESGIKYATFVPAVSMLLLRNFLYRLTQRYVVEKFHATILCYGVGTVGLTGGLVASLVTLLPTGVSLLGLGGLSLLFVGGVVFFLLGVALDIQQNSDLSYRLDPRPDASGHG